MEDYDLPYPDEDDNFEDQYADELEVLNEIGVSDGPPSRKSLNFDAYPMKALDLSSEDVSIDSNQKLTPSKKRTSDDMYGTIPDDDDEDFAAKTFSDLEMDILGPCKKRTRHISPESNSLPDLNGSTLPSLHNGLRKSSSPLRSQIYLDGESLVNSHPTSTRNPAETRRPNVFTRPIMGKESVTVTRMDGQRLYLSLQDQPSDCSSKENKLPRSSQMPGHNSLQLLQTPFSVIRQHVDEERRRKMTEESDRIAASLRRALQGDTDADDMDSNDATTEIPEQPQHALWVEKYSPKLFTELLSDDAINRTLLKWLKLWDKVVFNKTKDPDKRQNAQLKKEKESEKHGQPGKGFKKFNKGGIESEEWIEVDANGYPVHKVALLCGPPGLGKTTLAHVIARHAGYNVVEMNASDDRTAEVFKQKIETATQMKSVLGQNERPNCLVIDEIDGAPTPAINVLVSVVKKKESDGAKSKKKTKSQPLSRPIICICNDQFVPSLRQLRQLALVAVFPKTIPGRLSVRLNEIAKRECVKTDMTTLLALCDKADNDIRSCLNTLQFVHKRHGHLSLEYVQSADVGQKDLHKNLFTIMQEVFQLPKPKRKRFAGFNENIRRVESNGGFGGDSGLDQSQSVSPVTSRFHNVLRSVSSCGQYEKLTQGLFENYLNIKFKDSGFNAIVSGTEWLEFSDFIEQQVNSSQQYILRRYSPFLSVSFHLLYATPTSSKLSYPSTQYECYLKKVKTSNLITTMKSEASPRIRRMMDERIACIELFPLLLEILTPNMRPVNMQLFSSREKQQLAELIDSMIAYNVTYHQERNYEGQYSYVLDPNIEEVVKFPSLPQHKQLTYANKQLIAREIDLEKMRRAEKITRARDGTDHKLIPTKKAANLDKPTTVLKPEPKKVNIQATAKVALDFFGQPIKAKTDNSPNEGPNPTHSSKDNSSQLIWFKFNEGYSNAVRKNVKIQDLL